MEIIKIISPGDMSVERYRIELGEDSDSENIGVDAVTNGDINQAILPGNRDSGLGTQHGQRVKALTLTASQNHCEDIIKAWHSSLPPKEW
jgi:hypothetical protein